MLTAVTLALVLQMRFQSPGCTAGEGWEFVVRGQDLDKSPRWLESSEAPPLPARAAIRAGRSVLRRMSCKEAEQWELGTVALRPILGEQDLWVYLITFVEPFDPPKRRVLGSVSRRVIEIPVLLDGTALLPSVGRWPPKR